MAKLLDKLALSPRMEARFGDLARALRMPFVYKKIWDELLTTDERRRVTKSKTIGPDIIDIWRKLKKLPDLHTVANLAYEMGFLMMPEYDRIRESISKIENYVPIESKPKWHKEFGELLYEEKVVRRIKRPAQATNVVLLLDVFEEEDWPTRIDDPFPVRIDPRCLRETIASLNKGLTSIRFEADGSGMGVRWKRCRTPSRAPSQLR